MDAHDSGSAGHAITTDQLTKRYGAVSVVKGLALKVPHGSIFGFLGANGAGKTTTIRMLLGLVRPSSGEARVLGFDSVRERGRLAPHVGAIVETPAFYPYLTGDENLRALSLGAGETVSAERRKALLARVGLAGSGDRKVKEYSLGMKQRLGIAAALLSEPRLLFLDEPTNGLDPDGAREMRDLLSAIQAEGRTIFLSSHLLGEVERICTDVAILRGGEVRLQGRTAELLARGGVEIRLSSQVRAAALLSLPARGEWRDEAGWIAIDAEDAGIPPVLRTLLGAGIDVFEVRPRRATLEALFFETTGWRAGPEVRS